MSKAFINENQSSDGNANGDDEDIPQPKIPAGSKNYMTPAGFQKLRDELQHLLNKERPTVTATVSWAASNGDRSENADYIYGKRRLREIDRRIRFLTKRLESAEVVDPAQKKSDQIFFGATVTVCDEEGEEKTYSIVGVDEIDFSKNHISWVSPLALALMKARVGDLVNFKSPKGPRELEVVRIEYKTIG